jgi:hypothetical protein
LADTADGLRGFTANSSYETDICRSQTAYKKDWIGFGFLANLAETVARFWRLLSPSETLGRNVDSQKYRAKHSKYKNHTFKTFDVYWIFRRRSGFDFENFVTQSRRDK